MVFLSNINTFGYNPLKLHFRHNLHFSALQDSEVISKIEEIEWNINAGDDLPEFVKLEYLKQLKKSILTNSLCPFMVSFTQSHVQPFSPSDCQQIAADVAYLIKQATADSQDSLLAVKKVIDSVLAQFTNYRGMACKSGAKACLLLASLQKFENVIPPAKLADFICGFVFDDFMAHTMMADDHVRAIACIKAVLVGISVFRLYEDANFRQKLTYRYSLLPVPVQFVVKDFFK